MVKFLKKIRDYFDPPQSGTVEYEYYVRTGQCNQCGKCCSDIYLIHGETVIPSIEAFNRLKQQHADYQHFIPMEETELGVVFQCKNLQPDNSCGIYEDRPAFCKKYPSEASIMLGGKLAASCGFTFKAKHSFSEALGKAAAQKKLKSGKLLFDVSTVPLPKDQHRDVE